MKQHVEFTNLSDFMKASPFDPEYDLNKSLSKETYYDQLHVHTNRTDELTKKLQGVIESKLEPNRVIFMHGYAGNGKTTFLHSFMRTDSNTHVYYDFQELRTTVHDLTEDDASDELQLLLNRHLRAMGGFEETLNFIRSNRRVLKDADFISARLYAVLDKSSDALDSETASYCVDAFQFKDTFAVTFAHLFLTFTKRTKTILYFDNLDVVPMDHIAHRFLVHFQNGIASATHIARSDPFARFGLDFRRDFRFIFCMRDANDAILNEHLATRTGFVRAPFVVTFDTEQYRMIAEKRIRFIETHFPNENINTYKGGEFSTILGNILADEYFKDVFLPLYNNDYREVAGLLIRLIAKFGITPLHGKFERRGILMFGIIESLLTKDFLRDYMSIQADPYEGYCYIDRVMLTVLINCSRYRRGGAHAESCEPYSLFYLVQELNKIYNNVPAILRSIARCFVSHQLNRVHLVTVLNRRVPGVEEFVYTYNDLFDMALRDSDDGEVARITNELTAIQVRLNPAGFTYVRYILPHFEFYSNLVAPSSGGGKTPLFTDPLRRVKSGADSIFLFEAKIDAVFQQVSTHISSMKKFFEARYTAVMEPENFPTSIYCFRHPGTVKLATTRGHSHTIKIVTAHIDYIDVLRLQLVKNPANAEYRRAVNESLVSRIEGYVQLLSQAPDRDVASRFQEQFSRAIDAIRKSNYDDISTRIEREGPRARDERAEPGTETN